MTNETLLNLTSPELTLESIKEDRLSLLCSYVCVCVGL